MTEINNNSAIHKIVFSVFIYHVFITIFNGRLVENLISNIFGVIFGFVFGVILSSLAIRKLVHLSIRLFLTEVNDLINSRSNVNDDEIDDDPDWWKKGQKAPW